MICPCGGGPTLEECCGPYLSGESNAPTAEALMRSRYTAVTKGLVDYLIETHHPELILPMRIITEYALLRWDTSEN